MKLFSSLPVKSLFTILACGVIPFVISPPVAAETLAECALRQESFGFNFDSYAIEHQGWAMMDMTVDFRYYDAPEADRASYVNFVPMAAEIDRFLKEYPNEKDYWEIVNRKLVESLLEQYPKISSLRIGMFIEGGSSDDGFDRHSIVTLTREGDCPLTHEIP